MLVGQFGATLTEKGRLAIPARFRRELGDKIVVTKWLEGCLVALPQEKFMGMVQNLIGTEDTASLSVRETERFLLGSAFEADMDTQGRFVVPQILREYANLVDDVVFIGLGERFEIWNKKSWSEKEKLIQESADQLVEKLVKNRQ
ncbi:MAG TPA: division/cell wall cluster transcriptional repressor MraZ [Patescibacteria group bacterium]|nr:division/cell wall cluster transcriptional repressor MraZ [Patescibacteria group bacterium]